MIIGNGNSYIRLEFQDVTSPEFRDDIAVSVALAHQGFCGEDERVWFDESERSGFINALRQLEKSRHGQVKLSSIAADSPHDGFILEIYTTDTMGHLAVSADLKKAHFVGGRLKTLRVMVDYELDPEYIPHIARQFEALFDSQSQKQLLKDKPANTSTPSQQI